MPIYKVEVTDTDNFEHLLNSMAEDGWKLISFSDVGGIFNITAVFIKER